MKFAAVVVVLALAMGIDASGLAWGSHYAPALSYTAVSGPAVHGAWGDHGAWGAHGAWAAAPAAVAVDGAWGHGAWGNGAWAAPAAVATHSAWGAPAIVTGHSAWTAPAAVAVHGHGAWAPAASWADHGVGHHAAIIPAAHSTWGHEGSYVAKTRGAVHVAPLAGHANSAASINLQPAPGTV